MSSVISIGATILIVILVIYLISLIAAGVVFKSDENELGCGCVSFLALITIAIIVLITFYIRHR